jgi:PhnB protein
VRRTLARGSWSVNARGDPDVTFVVCGNAPSCHGRMALTDEPDLRVASSLQDGVRRRALTREEPALATRLNPYLNFPGTARRAMEFYEAVFGGELSVMTFADAGADDAPEPAQVMHAMLETPSGFTLMASDMPPGMDLQVGNSIAVSLSGDDAEELRRYWTALSDEGSVTMPLEMQMWGDEFGACTDRFGVSWMVDIGVAPQA